MRIKGIQHHLLAAATMLLLFPPRPAQSAPPPAAQAAGVYRDPGEMLLEPLDTVGKIPRKTSGLLFKRAREETPAAQMAAARQAEAEKSLRRASRAYDALVRRWPHAPEAPAAQLKLAELNAARGKYSRAFDDYRYLIRYYPEHAALGEDLPRMLAFANHYRGEGKDERALEMYIQVAELAPRWRGTAQALLQAGMLQVADKKWYDAVSTLERLGAGFPGTDEARTAAAQSAHVLHRISLRYAEDDSVQLRARAALAATLRDYPGHPERERLQEELDELDARRYQRHFDMAAFYDTPRYKPEAAATAYREFIRKFPLAPQAATARRRIEALDHAPRNAAGGEDRK